MIQLSTNYRSHEQILDLANSVVNLIEIFFPKSIDKLIKEGSMRVGLKPIVLEPVDNKLLRKFFLGAQVSNFVDDSNNEPSADSKT